MKKIIYLAFCLMCFTACENTQKQQSDNTESRDSLQRVIEQKRNQTLLKVCKAPYLTSVNIIHIAAGCVKAICPAHN